MKASATSRVLVTGVGLVTPLGATTIESWRALLHAKTALSALRLFDASDLPVRIAAQVDRKSVADTPSPLSSPPDFARFALAASFEALRDAGLESNSHGTPRFNCDRAGVSMGVGMSNLPDAIHAAEQLSNNRYRRITPFLIPRILPNTPASLLALAHGLRGPSLAPATACAAGAHALGDAFHAISRGDADVMLAGGSEAAINRLSVAGFARAKALTTSWNDTPEAASRPFDERRDGFVIGEGAAVLVLESENHARKRAFSRAYAELAGFGMTGDAYHITAPAPDGNGAIRAMRAALNVADVNARDVDYVNAHATSTKLGDAIERAAIAHLLPETLAGKRSVVSSTKGATGHLLGAAGAMEAAFTALAVCTKWIPPTVNLETLDVDPQLQKLGWHDISRYVPKVAVEKQVDVAICNSFGFGGTNACVLFKSPPKEMARQQL